MRALGKLLTRVHELHCKDVTNRRYLFPIDERVEKIRILRALLQALDARVEAATSVLFCRSDRRWLH